MAEYSLDVPNINIKNPLFLSENIFSLGTLSGDTTQNLNAITNPFLNTSYEKNGIFAGVAVVLSAPITANAIGLANHTFNGLTNVVVQFSENSGASYQTIGIFTPAPGVAFFSTFPRSTGNAWRVFFGPQLGLKIGYMCVGPTVSFERGIYSGVNPIPLADETRYLFNQGEAQYFTNRVLSERVTQEVRVSNVSGEWMRLYGLPLSLALQKDSTFYAWRMQKYPSDILYGWAQSDASATHSGPRDLMEWSVTLQGIAK
jgi:hypothetical protein